MSPDWMQSTFVFYAFRTAPRSEMVVVLLFLFLFGVVYAFSAIMLLQWLIRKLRRKAAPTRGRWRRVTRTAVLTLAAIGLLCMLYAWKVEPYWPQISTWRVPTTKLPKGAQPIRIVHISDTHCEGKVRLEERLPDLIAQQRPDLIVFTGDAVSDDEGKPIFRRLMTRLAAVAPTYAVRGNWEDQSSRGADLYTGTKVVELRNQTARLDIRGTPLYLAGVAFPRWDLACAIQHQTLAQPGVAPEIPWTSAAWSCRDRSPAYDGALSVLLYHTPDILAQIPVTTDLALAGHTHGGQIALPFYGGMITLAREGKKYERDMRTMPNGNPIHISRGIGLEGGRAPRMRFFARPDVSVIEITPSEP